MKRIAASFLLLYCLIAQAPPAQAKNQAWYGFARVLKNETNFRESPGGDLIWRLEANEAVFVKDKTTDNGGTTWYHAMSMQNQHTRMGYLRADTIQTQDSLLHGVKEVSFVSNYLMALWQDGRVMMIGGNGGALTRGVANWERMRGVAAGHFDAVGIHTDGQAELLGDGPLRQPLYWDSPVARVFAGRNMVAAINQDGTASVYATFSSPDLLMQQAQVLGQVTDLALWNLSVFGLRPDGTVELSLYTPEEEDPPYPADYDKFSARWASWTDITAIACGWDHLVGLKKDGTVVTTLTNDRLSSRWEHDISLRENPSMWTDITAIAAYANYTLGLKSDGTVLMAGDGPDASALSDIVWIHAGDNLAFALDNHGTLYTLDDGRFAFWELYNAKFVVVESK